MNGCTPPRDSGTRAQASWLEAAEGGAAGQLVRLCSPSKHQLMAAATAHSPTISKASKMFSIRTSVLVWDSPLRNAFGEEPSKGKK